LTAGDCPPPEQARLLLHIRRVGTGLLLIAGVAAATFARDVLLPVVFAFFNATTLRPQARGGVPTSLISI
jgi:predicted PurR-regulated permease PerM